MGRVTKNIARLKGLYENQGIIERQLASPNIPFGIKNSLLKERAALRSKMGHLFKTIIEDSVKPIVLVKYTVENEPGIHYQYLVDVSQKEASLVMQMMAKRQGIDISIIDITYIQQTKVTNYAK